MQRYFIDQNADINQRFFITDQNDIHHITKVMRYQIGDQIIITFSDQSVYKCKIENMTMAQIEITLIEKIDIDSELPQHITICSGLIKADKYEWMIQKSTELGASQFIAVGMQRSVVKLNENKVIKKLESWQKNIKEDNEKRYRLIIPEIEYKSNLKEIYDIIDEYDY